MYHSLIATLLLCVVFCLTASVIIAASPLMYYCRSAASLLLAIIHRSLLVPCFTAASEDNIWQSHLLGWYGDTVIPAGSSHRTMSRESMNEQQQTSLSIVQWLLENSLFTYSNHVKQTGDTKTFAYPRSVDSSSSRRHASRIVRFVVSQGPSSLFWWLRGVLGWECSKDCCLDRLLSIDNINKN